jgi:hypothetical protein
VKLVVPVASFFLEEGLELSDTGLAKVENIHGAESRKPNHSRFRSGGAKGAERSRRTSATDATQRCGVQAGGRKPRATIFGVSGVSSIRRGAPKPSGAGDDVHP